jgi:hypothetical protein
MPEGTLLETPRRRMCQHEEAQKGLSRTYLLLKKWKETLFYMAPSGHILQEE